MSLGAWTHDALSGGFCLLWGGVQALPATFPSFLGLTNGLAKVLERLGGEPLLSDSPHRQALIPRTAWLDCPEKQVLIPLLISQPVPDLHSQFASRGLLTDHSSALNGCA